MSTFDFRKYKPYLPIVKNDRRWPNRVIEHAPNWCSVDLRDGNQALIEPMRTAQKARLFQLLVDVGFKEIEVGFPAAAQPEFEFVRHLIENDLIPVDVTIQVLTQARQDLIERTFESLKGARRAIVHVYNSTSSVQRRLVFGKSREEIKQLAVTGAEWVREYAERLPETQWQFQYSPESFTGTEVDYAVEVCDAVIDVWQPTPQNLAIINLPATVEMTTPNVFADQVEWVCDNIANRESIIISLHTHNDRGCGVAAAELGLMAGADRVEGTLLGNGERTGNMDIVTAAMNLYSRGVDPALDLSNMDRIISTVEFCTQLKVHPRHPYAGELVFAAFSGSHQDAINKSLVVYEEGTNWEIPYLPIDPRDLGRTYQEVIRINSQSGKGGIAYILKQEHNLQVPRWMQVDFSPHVQRQAEVSEGEVVSHAIGELFDRTYMNVDNAPTVNGYTVANRNDRDLLSATLVNGEVSQEIEGVGKGPLDAFIGALNTISGRSVVLVDYSEHTLGNNEESEAISYVQISFNGKRYCGAGKSTDVLRASFQAVLNAIARAEAGDLVLDYPVGRAPREDGSASPLAVAYRSIQ
ncbi:MAG: 2-isopropylmalate synthase [Acidihalobacter sp.]